MFEEYLFVGISLALAIIASAVAVAFILFVTLT